MVGSLDSMDFNIDVAENTKDTIPLHCWQTISLNEIWIPSQLLSNRNKGCKKESTDVIYRTLQKKDTSKYSESFSSYVDPSYKNEQDDVFHSDSDEDILSTSMNLEEFKRLSDNLSVKSDNIPTHIPKSFIHNKEKYFENDNSVFKRNGDSVHSNLKASSLNNLCNFDEQRNSNMLSLESNPEKSNRSLGTENNIFIQNIGKMDYNGGQSSSASKSTFLGQIKGFDRMQTLKKVDKDSDYHISLNEIVNDAPVTSLKDFDYNFGIRKKEKDLDDYSFCDKQKLNSKKTKKEKKGKKLEKCVPLESLFEDMSATQEFNCNRYLNSVLQDRERYARIGDNPLVSKEEYPDLTPEELTFIHSGNRMDGFVEKGKYAEIVGNSLHSKKYQDLTSEALACYHSDNTMEGESTDRGNYVEIVDNSSCSQDYPGLTSEEISFYHSDSIVKGEDVEFTPKFSFIRSDKASKREVLANEEISNDTTVEVEETIVQRGKIAVENIPLDVSEDDISMILSGYGEIENFSMISNGKCLNVLVEINLICDIDWVIECLDGSEPFGTSTGVLKCYQLTE